MSPLLLDRYQCYLVTERGLAPVTVREYAYAVRPFLAGRERAGGLGLEDLTAAEVTAFVLATCPGKPRSTARRTVKALRSLLGFLHVTGLIREPLGLTVPAVASWRMTGLPRALEPGQVAALLASCDQGTATGRRDFAMLTMLARRLHGRHRNRPRHRHRRRTEPAQIAQQRPQRLRRPVMRVTGGPPGCQEPLRHPRLQPGRVQPLILQPPAQMSHHQHLAIGGLTRVTKPGQFTSEPRRIRPQRPGHPGPQRITHDRSPLQESEDKSVDQENPIMPTILARARPPPPALAARSA